MTTVPPGVWRVVTAHGSSTDVVAVSVDVDVTLGAVVVGVLELVDAGSVVVVALGAVVAVEAEEEEEEVVEGVAVVVEERSNSGAATLRGDAGRSTTSASAALTICQVTAVVAMTSVSHPRKIDSRFISLDSPIAPGVPGSRCP